MSETLFSKIIARQIPAHIIYEDTHVISFLDINPLSYGHILVIPKEAKAQMHELSEESAAALGRVLPKMARALLKVTGADGYNLLQNNGASAHQSVFHVHVHLIPQFSSTGKGLGLNWMPSQLTEGERLREKYATALTEELGRNLGARS